MASPQCEDGFTKIANETVEEFCKLNLSAYEWRVLWVVFRKTYGWHKKRDNISISQIQELTRLDRRNISRSIIKLINKNIIFRNDQDIEFNKDYDTWNKTNILKAIVYRDTRPHYFSTTEGKKYRCEYCLKLYIWDKTENHHIIPKSMGGADNKKNTILVCFKCHAKIHAELEDFLSSIQTTDNNIVPLDDIQKWYRLFVSKVSSIQTTFLSSQETTLVSSKETSTKESLKKRTKETLTKDTLSRNPNVKKFIDHYHDKFLDRFNEKPMIDGGKDGKIIKTLLGTYDLEILKEFLDRFFDSTDPFILQGGYTIGVFKSQINKLIAGLKVDPKTASRYITIKQWEPKNEK